VRAVELLHAAQHEGADPIGFVLGLVEHLRNLLLLSVDPALRRAVQLGESHLQRAEALAQRFCTEDLLYLLNRAASLHEEVRQSSQPTVVLEAAMVELARFESRVLLSEVLDKLGSGGAIDPPASRGGAGSPGAAGGREALRGRGGAGGTGSSLRSAADATQDTGDTSRGVARGRGPVGPAGGPEAVGGPLPPRAARAPAAGESSPRAAVLAAAASDLGTVQERWQEFTQVVAGTKAMLAQCLAEGVPARLEGTRLHVEFRDTQMFHLEMLQQPNARAELEQLLARYFGRPLQLVPYAPQNDAPDAPPASARLTHEDIVQGRREALVDVTKRVPRLQEILDTFDAEILDDRDA